MAGFLFPDWIKEIRLSAANHNSEPGLPTWLIVFALAGLFPGLSLLMSVLIGVWGLWILLHFITAALGLPSLLHALGTLVLGAVGLVLGLGILLSLVGAVAQGVLPNV